MATDPWALLREARDTLDSEASTPEELDFVARIDAALAERQDSSTDVAEWRPSNQRVFLDGVDLRILYQTDGTWLWSVYWPLSHRTEQGRVATEAEAKTAAIAAAKGMK